MYAKIWVFEQFNVKDFVENLVELVPLASASLISTLCLCFFYEVDVLIAGQLFEAGDIAVYALCITVLNFIRSIYNVILGPALPILNRLKGERNDQGVLVVAAGAALVGGAFVFGFGCGSCVCCAISHPTVGRVRLRGFIFATSHFVDRWRFCGSGEYCFVFKRLPAGSLDHHSLRSHSGLFICDSACLVYSF